MRALKEQRMFAMATQLVLCFALSSFIGWLYEIVAGYLVWGQYVDRGILRLPLCPIYGFGAWMMIALFRKPRNGVFVFACSAALATLLELVISYLTEWIFQMRLWSYVNWPLHFQGRISLISSVIFGVFGCFVIYALYPLIRKIVSLMPVILGMILDILLVSVITADAVCSVKALIG